MDDFSTPGKSNGFNLPPSPANFIQPFKRPQSSMCPAIVLDEKGNAVFVVGSAGGSKITTAVAHVSQFKFPWALFSCMNHGHSNYYTGVC